MTAERLIGLLRGCGADGWELTESRQDQWEFYFIRHRLDQHRVRALHTYDVRLYRLSEDGTSLGSAGGEIPPTATDDEARDALARTLQNAAYVRNPVYTLNEPQPVEVDAGADVSPAEMAGAFLEVMSSLPETQTEDVNSWELFCAREATRFVNSRGVDVCYSQPASTLEVVVNARRDGREIELYRLFTGGGCDRDALRARLREALDAARERLSARPTPALGRADVLFTTEAAVELYEFFASRMDAAFKYRGYSSWEEGRPIDGALAGDRVTLRALRSLPFSSENAPIDGEGAPVRDTTLIEDGVARHFLGSRQFSCYLNLESSFIPGCLEASGGTAEEADLRGGAYLEAREFSDFQVDPMTGDIAGEIRLAIWHDGTRAIPVTGGSVSGSMLDFMRTMRMSRRLTQYDSWRIPALTRLYGVRITGADGKLREDNQACHKLLF